MCLWGDVLPTGLCPDNPVTNPPYPSGRTVSLGLPTLHAALPHVLPLSRVSVLIPAFGHFLFYHCYFGPLPFLNELFRVF